MLSLLAQTISSAPAPAAPTSQPAPGWLVTLQQFGPFALILIFFFVFTGGTKKKQERERKMLLDNLKKGDRIRLIGGEYGTVVEVKDTKVVVKVDEGSNTKITYARDAVQAVEKDETATK